MSLALVTATEKEMQAVMPRAPKLTPGVPFAGQWRGEGLWLMITGMGPVNAAAGIGSLLQMQDRFDGIVNLGVAGSFDLSSLTLLSPVVVSEEIWPELGLRTENGIDLEGIREGMGSLDGEMVQNRINLYPEHALSLWGRGSLPWSEGRSLTVAGMSGSRKQAKRYQEIYQPDLENMEGFALAWPCMRSKIPFLQLRCVSNLVGSRKRKNWDMRGALKQLPAVWEELAQGLYFFPGSESGEKRTDSL